MIILIGIVCLVFLVLLVERNALKGFFPVEDEDFIEIPIVLRRNEVLLAVYAIVEWLNASVLDCLHKLVGLLTEKQRHVAEVTVDLNRYVGITNKLALSKFIILSDGEVLIRLHQVDSAREN